jgi:hypothetical protein
VTRLAVPLAATVAGVAVFRRARRDRQHAEECLAAAAELRRDADRRFADATDLTVAAMGWTLVAGEIAEAVEAGDRDRVRDLVCRAEEMLPC